MRPAQEAEESQENTTTYNPFFYGGSATAAAAFFMLKDGLITEEQYAIIDTKMREKYQPIIGTLYPENA